MAANSPMFVTRLSLKPETEKFILIYDVYSVSQKKSPLKFSDIFPQRLVIFNQFLQRVSIACYDDALCCTSYSKSVLRLSVRQSHAGTVSKRLKLRWLKIAYFSYPSLIWHPRSLCSLWNFAVMLTMRKLESWG